MSSSVFSAFIIYGIWTTVPEENSHPVRIGVWVKVRVSFRVGGQPDNCPRLGLKFGLGLVLGFGVEGGGQFSLGVNVLEPLLTYCILLAEDQNSFYETRSLAVRTTNMAFNQFNGKQLHILKTFLDYLELYIVVYWR